MNERIKELWTQAGGHYNSGNQHTWPQYTIDDPKKFAELIVKECANVAADHDGLDIYEEIREHFGVSND